MPFPEMVACACSYTYWTDWGAKEGHMDSEVLEQSRQQSFLWEGKEGQERGSRKGGRGGSKQEREVEVSKKGQGQQIPEEQ